MHGVKRKNLSKACFLCQKAHALCDEQQPCGRCISQGVAHMCFFSDENKKKPAPSEPGGKEPMYPAKEPRKPIHSNSDEIMALILTELREMREEQRRLHDDVRLLRMQHEKLELRLINHPATTTPPHQPNGLHGSPNNQDPHRHYHPFSLTHDHGHGIHLNGCPQCAMEEASRVPSPTTSAGLGNLGNHYNIPNPSLPQQNNVANSNMSALTTMGGVGMGTRNGAMNGLVDIMEQLKTNATTRQFGLPTKATEGELNGKAVATKNANSTLIVVFDLTVQPPTVMTATDNFCKVMGYEMQEVVGLPWHKFIHPNNLQRTMNTLNQANMNTSIQFPQLYKTKDGHMLKTLDTHKIFYDGEGRPISDIVSISPLASKGPYKERSSKAKDNSSTALALYASPLIYSFNSPPATPSPNSSPVVSSGSTEIPTPALEEITNSDTFYNNLSQPIVEDLHMGSPSPNYMNYTPSSATPASPSPTISTSNNIPPSPSTLASTHLPPHILQSHHPAFTIDDHTSSSPSLSTTTTIHEPTPLSASTASLLLQNPPDSFDNQVAMDDEEIYRYLIPHEVRPYPLEEWLAQTHISPSPPK